MQTHSGARASKDVIMTAALGNMQRKIWMSTLFNWSAASRDSLSLILHLRAKHGICALTHKGLSEFTTEEESRMKTLQKVHTHLFVVLNL